MRWREITHLFISIPIVLGLQSAPLPNGQPKRFTPNHASPASDLKEVDSYHAMSIARRWTEDIILHPVINKEDKHIIERIQRFENFIHTNEDQRYFNFVWEPIGQTNEAIFIVLLHVNDKTNTLRLSLVIPSPYWESSQIESLELKRAIENFALKTKKTLCLDRFYQNDIRFRLEWKYWS